MSSKNQAQPQDATGTLVLAEYGPCISLASVVLATVIPLQGHETVACYVFTPAPTSNPVDHLDLLESARRTLVHKYAQSSLLDSLLPYVRVTGKTPALYIFALGTLEALFPHGSLSRLHLDGLELSSSSIFPIQDIYACSPNSSDLPSACADFPTGSANECHGLLPRNSLQIALQYLMEALRARLIDDASAPSTSARTAIALKDGFVLASSSPASDWSAGWNHHAHHRPLMYCQLQICFMPHPARIIVHPLLRPTTYLRLPTVMPLPSGMPVVLLPYGTPAYYLTMYTGPSAALTAQFEEALVGRGVKCWKDSDQPTGRPFVGGPSYIIAWVSVQNKQGEDKGVTLIWPISLCLSYCPSASSPHARSSILQFPDLPAQLQASPPPPPPSIPSTLMSLTHDIASVPEPDHPCTPPIASASLSRRPGTLLSSPSSDAVNAFRTLSLTVTSYPRDLPSVAEEVSSYVDAVAKERERERERIKKERENAAAKSRTPSSSHVVIPAVPSQPPSEPPIVQSPSAPVYTEQPTLALPSDVATVDHAMAVDQDDSDQQASSGDESLGSLFSPPPSSQELPSVEVAGEPFEQVAHDVTRSASSTLVHSVTPHPLPDTNQAGSSNFDPFAGFESAWAHNTNGFMDMHMDYDMGFNMNGASLGGVQSSAGTAGDFNIDDDFNFTDDDFNFFDAPATQTNAPLASQNFDLNLEFDLPPSITPMAHPMLVMDGLNTSGPGPPSAAYGQGSPWVAPTPTEIPSPFDTEFTAAPDLLPPSPTRTLTSHSAPVTPSVQLTEPDDVIIAKVTHLRGSPGVFDPIPFSSTHKLADGKYMVGKFAPLSAPGEEDSTEQSLFVNSVGWKAKYTAATDPRVGIVRKLIGVKRKSGAHGQRDVEVIPAWLREHEEWEGSSDTAEPRSESESDDDEPWIDDDDAKTASRPLTPPPSYLPLGPTLLQTQFHHSRLLPLGMPVSSSGADDGQTHVSTPPMSVPTPVSPAAIIGAASEKSKSLEAAAQILVKEVVENITWAQAWRVSSVAAVSSSKPPAHVWQADVRDVLLRLSKYSSHVPTLWDLFLPDVQADSRQSSLFMQLMDSPLLAVGKSDVIVQVLPSALHFWEKLGLSPRSGRKDVCAYVFFEGAGDEKEAEIGAWLEKVSAAYSAKSYGKHSSGNCDSYVKPGLVPVRFDSVKKTLVNFASSLPPQPASTSLVFYIIIPSSIISLSSQPLRHILSAVKRTLKTHTETQILFQLVPEPLITSALADPRTHHAGLEPFVDSVYNRILQPADRMMSRPLLANTLPTRAYFHAPAFALARPLPGQCQGTSLAEQVHRAHVSFSIEPHATRVDVLDRYALLHVGYQTTPCGRWLLAACIDARGEEHDLGAWLMPEEDLEPLLVERVWSFIHGFARRANVEWRVVVAKSGAMAPAELAAWTEHLDVSVSSSAEVPPLHVTLLSVEHEVGWTFIAPGNQSSAKQTTPPLPHRPSSRSHSNSVLTDISSTTYAIFPPGFPAPVPVPHTASADAIPGNTDVSYVAEVDEDERREWPAPCMLARRMSLLVNVPAGTDYTAIDTVQLFLLHSAQSPKSTYVGTSEAGGHRAAADTQEEETLRDVTRNFYELAVLSRARWRLDAAPGLPFHLAALEVMKTTLSSEAVE